MAYQANNDTGREIGWDESFDNQAGSYVLLPEMDCPFTVTKMERQRYGGGAKIPACNMALLTLSLDGGSEGTATVLERLYLHTSQMRKLSNFLVSIGQARRDDEVIRPNWQQVVGATGVCHVTRHTYTKKDGSQGESNQISRYYPPEDTPAPVRPEQAAPVQSQQQAMPGYSARPGHWQAGNF
ncbi:MAG: hypothetical protein LIO70_06930 [Clostridiales bacterium]|nr:hypothetical protein [Clostridiales bacterium]